jgi:hypothetical protein
MRMYLCGFCVLMGGCGPIATTEVKPSTSSVRSKTDEKRPTETQTVRMTVSTTSEQHQTYRLKIVPTKESPCETQSSPSAQPSQFAPNQ